MARAADRADGYQQIAQQWDDLADQFEGPRALIGFHAVYNAFLGRETELGDVGAYLNEF